MKGEKRGFELENTERNKTEREGYMGPGEHELGDRRRDLSW